MLVSSLSTLDDVLAARADATVAAATEALGGGGVWMTSLLGVTGGLCGIDGLFELEGCDSVSSESVDSSPGRERTLGLEGEGEQGAGREEREGERGESGRMEGNVHSTIVVTL